MVDYKVLLAKYIALVVSEEGTDFLLRVGNKWSNQISFSDEEADELKHASMESKAYLND